MLIIRGQNQKWGREGRPSSCRVIRAECTWDSFLKPLKKFSVRHTGNTANGLNVMIEVINCAELVSVKVICELAGWRVL